MKTRFERAKRGLGISMALLSTAALLGIASPTTTLGQVQVGIQLNLPAVLPPLVQVRPGVRVVRDLDDEVFFADGRYWVRRDDSWYHSRNPRGRWVQADRRRVPAGLTVLPPGLFRHWQGRPVTLPERLPPLVVVRPGVRVVQDFDDEIFFVGGYYWLRRDNHWFRTRDHRGRWEYVPPGRAPGDLARFQPGQYRRWRGGEGEHSGKHEEKGHGRGEGREEGRDRH